MKILIKFFLHVVYGVIPLFYSWIQLSLAWRIEVGRENSDKVFSGRFLWCCSIFFHRFSSHLPGGSKAGRRGGSKGGGYCILDCVFHELDQTFFVLDMMAWKVRQPPEVDTAFFVAGHDGLDCVSHDLDGIFCAAHGGLDCVFHDLDGTLFELHTVIWTACSLSWMLDGTFFVLDMMPWTACLFHELDYTFFALDMRT